MEQFRKTVAKNIAELRVANGYTQFELGEKINYSDKAVSKWERGESVPDAYVLKKLAGIFEVSVDYLLEEHPDDAKKPKARNKYKTITQISFLGTYTRVQVYSRALHKPYRHLPVHGYAVSPSSDRVCSARTSMYHTSPDSTATA